LQLNNSALLSARVTVGSEAVLRLVLLAVVVFPILRVGVVPLGRITQLLAQQAHSCNIEAANSLVTSRRRAVVFSYHNRACDGSVLTANRGVAFSGCTISGVQAGNGSIHTTIPANCVQANIFSASILIIT